MLPPLVAEAAMKLVAALGALGCCAGGVVRERSQPPMARRRRSAPPSSVPAGLELVGAELARPQADPRVVELGRYVQICGRRVATAARGVERPRRVAGELCAAGQQSGVGAVRLQRELNESNDWKNVFIGKLTLASKHLKC